MVVNFTTYANLAKPSESELALNWTRVQDLQEDNNLEIEARANVDNVSYTPTVISAGTQPNLGTGFAAYGEYRNLNGFILGGFRVDIGSSPSAGTGIYAFSLPFVADSVFHAVNTNINALPGDFDVIGTGYMFDTSTLNTSGPAALDILTVSGVSYVRFLVSTFTGKSSYALSPGVPFTIAQSDSFNGSFAYKRT